MSFFRLLLLGSALLASALVASACDGETVPTVASDVVVADTSTAGDTSTASDTSTAGDTSDTSDAANSAPDVSTADASADISAATDIVEVIDPPFACEGAAQVTNVTPAQLATMLKDKDFQFINVHIPFAGDIPGTDVSIAYNQTANLEAHLGSDTTAKAVLYCLTGPMSVAATQALAALGYCRIHDLPGGMAAWQAAGYSLR